MGCGCGSSGAGGGIAYRVLVPGQQETWVASIGEAKKLQGPAVVVEARTRAEMDMWLATQPPADPQVS